MYSIRKTITMYIFCSTFSKLPQLQNPLSQAFFFSSSTSLPSNSKILDHSLGEFYPGAEPRVFTCIHVNTKDLTLKNEYPYRFNSPRGHNDPTVPNNLVTHSATFHSPPLILSSIFALYSVEAKQQESALLSYQLKVQR